jgi:hypothetical protein
MAGTLIGEKEPFLMPALLPGRIMAGHGQPLARVLAVAVLTVPLVIIAVALVPAFVICPFLRADRQRLVVQLLDGLRQWAAALAGSSELSIGVEGPSSQGGE